MRLFQTFMMKQMTNKPTNIIDIYNRYIRFAEIYNMIIQLIQLISDCFNYFVNMYNYNVLKRFIIKQLNSILNVKSIKNMFKALQTKDYTLNKFENDMFAIENPDFKIEVFENDLMGRCFSFNLVEANVPFEIFLYEHDKIQEFRVKIQMDNSSYLYYCIQKSGDEFKLLIYAPLCVSNHVTSIEPNLAKQCFELSEQLKILIEQIGGG